jgi:prophage regulatory protein
MDVSNHHHAQRVLSERVHQEIQDREKDCRRDFQFEEEGCPDWQGHLSRRASPRLLRRPEVEDRTGLARSTLYDWMARGEFPQPVKLGARIVAWRESDVTQWLESRETRRA